MENLDKLKSPNVFIQIGTNTGNDSFRNLVKKYKPPIVVLVEPNQKLIPVIKKHYEFANSFSEVHIMNNAIYTEDDKEVSLFIPAKNGVYGQPGVQPERKQGNHTYNHGKFSLLPMNDWGEKKHMIEMKAPSITFNSLCEKLNITDVDYLQIDTEGFDSEIIDNINFDKCHISILRFERWNFGEECFSRYHNENKHRYGINGMKYIEDKLKDYKLLDAKEAKDMIAINNDL